MSNEVKTVLVALVIMLNGVAAAFLSKSIRDGNTIWYWTYITSFVSANVYAFQLTSKLIPLTAISVFQTFFFQTAWYVTAYFILSDEFKGYKIIGLLFAFVGMMIIAL